MLLHVHRTLLNDLARYKLPAFQFVMPVFSWQHIEGAVSSLEVCWFGFIYYRTLFARC